MRLLLVRVLPAVVFLSFWQLWAEGIPEREFLFATPQLVFQMALDELGRSTIYFDLYITTTETLLGFLLGSVLGIVAGLSLWVSRKVADVAKVYVVLIGAIPIFAIAPMMIVWFGTGMLSKVVMAAFSVFFVTLSQVYEGARSVSNERLTLARSLAASSGRVARLIIVPGSLLWVLSALKMNVSLALVGAFIGEFVSSEAGLGHYILKAGSLYDMPRVLFGIALISMLALTLTKVIDLVFRLRSAKGTV